MTTIKDTIVIVSIEELINIIKGMKFNTSISIAEEYNADTREGSSWWSIAKLRYADSRTLLFNYYGGGYPYAYPIDGAGDCETVENAVKGFFKDCRDFSEGRCYCIDIQRTDINAEAEKEN